jgi:CHAT domain-containing protein
MTEKIRILFLSANPWTTSRILVDEEAREIFERIQEGPFREWFELHKHTATRAIDLQRLLLMHKPHIVHFSGHGSKKHKIILGGAPGRGKTVDQQGLVEVLALYNCHLRLVLLNACFTKAQARSIAEVIDYSVGTGKGIGDKGGVAFAGAFYRALSFGKSIREAFNSAKAELVLTKMPRTQGIELFVRNGISEKDPFPEQTRNASNLRNDKLSSTGPFNSESSLVWKTTEKRVEITVFETSVISGSSKRTGSAVALCRGGKDR